VRRRFQKIQTETLPEFSRKSRESIGAEVGQAVRRIAVKTRFLRGVVGSTVHGTAVDGQDDILHRRGPSAFSPSFELEESVGRFGGRDDERTR